jgi:hypothetical protein
MMNAEDSNDSGGLAQAQAQYYKLWRVYQQQLDRITPFTYQRWGATAGLLFLFILRIVLAQGVSLYVLVNYLLSDWICSGILVRASMSYLLPMTD